MFGGTSGGGDTEGDGSKDIWMGRWHDYLNWKSTLVVERNSRGYFLTFWGGVFTNRDLVQFCDTYREMSGDTSGA